MRINKYIASCGICSRRKAELLIKNKLVRINGIVIESMSINVSDADIVTVLHKKIYFKEKIYLVIHKPCNVIVSKNDLKNRILIYDFISKNILLKYNIHAIGRLDLYSSGVLLLTNDGDLTNFLLHPRNNIIKVYYVTLNKSLLYSDLMIIKKGILLKEGVVIVDDIYYSKYCDKQAVIIKLHIGWNRVIRRIFNILNYKVLILHRISFANIMLKGLIKGQWRYLTKNEILNLKK